jgi:hypothetical protein
MTVTIGCGYRYESASGPAGVGLPQFSDMVFKDSPQVIGRVRQCPSLDAANRIPGERKRVVRELVPVRP